MRVDTGRLFAGTLVTVMLGLSGSALAQRDGGPAPPMRGWGMGPGMMGGYGPGPGMMGGWSFGPGMMGGGWGMGLGPGGDALGGIGLLDLSPAQRSKINAISDDLRKKHWALLGQIQDDEAKLRDLSSQPEPDPKAVGSVYVHMSKLRQQMIEAHANAMDQARAVLTPEQRGELDRWLIDSWGPRHPGRAGARKQP